MAESLSIAAAAASAELDLGVGFEGVGRQKQIERCRTVAHAPRSVVLAAVARAEPAAPFAARIGRLVAQRHAAEVGTDANQDDPRVVAGLHPVRVRLRFYQLG